MKKKREIDLLNTIFCLIVIFIHVISEPVSEADKTAALYFAAFAPWRLSSFVVQGFIFLSGMKMFLNYNPNRKTDYKKYCVSRFKKIIVPYVVSVTIYYVWLLHHGYFAEADLKDLLWYIVKGDMVSHFYFVVVIVQLYALRPLWELTVKYVNPFIAVAASFAVTLLMPRILPNFQYRDRLFATYLFYWIWGCCAGANYECFKAAAKKMTKITSAVFAAAALLNACLSFTGMTGRVSFLEELHTVYCASAIGFAYSLSLKFADGFMKNKLAQGINSASYYIYLIHCLFIYIINDFMSNNAGNMSLSGRFAVRVVFVYIVSIAVCIGYVNLKKYVVSRGKRIYN